MSVETGAPKIDGREFRNVLSHFCSGITILSSTIDEKPVGMTCQSFFSVSVDPPLVAFCVGKGSTTYPVLRTGDGLVINVLAHDQQELSSGFAASGTDKWAGVSWTPGEHAGHPVLDGALAALECTIHSETDAGDHVLVIAHVHQLAARQDSGPLLFFRGAYHQLG